MAEEITVREARSLEDIRAISGLLDRIWEIERVLPFELLRALAEHGNPVLVAERGGQVVGGQMGFFGMEEGRVTLHSHITGVAPDVQHTGVGFLLKRAQRDWCLAHDIDTVTWTFDPLISRNAYFNLRKLGSVGPRFLRNFYGDRTDAINVGERTDRMEVRWDLRSPRVAASAEGTPQPMDAEGAGVVLADEDGLPSAGPGRDAPRLLVALPPEHVALRREDPEAARVWRNAVADALEDAFERGYVAVDFDRDRGYLLERRE